MDKKYEFTGETNIVDGVVFNRIKAIMDIETNRGVVKAGELGGWIEEESNLSHDGGCWVFDEAFVYDDARVYGDACVYENAQVYENARVGGKALVHGNAQIYENASVCEKACVYEDALIYENAWVGGNAQICGNALVLGYAQICGEAHVNGNARIRKTSDYFAIGPIGSRDDYTTFFKGADGDIYVKCGCFDGSINEFTEAVKITHGSENKYASDYNLAIAIAKNRLTANKEERFMPVNVYLLSNLNSIVERMDETLSMYPKIIRTCKGQQDEKVVNEVYEDLKRARYQMDIAINKSVRCQKCGEKIGAKKYFRYLSVCGDANSNYPVCDKCLSEIMKFAGIPLYNDGSKE